MKFNQISTIIIALGVATTIDLLGVTKQASASTIRLTALTDNNALVTFDSNDLTDFETTGVTGLSGGETLLGIDVRPANGLIYGLTDANNIYTIDSTGAATLVSTLTVPFTGGQFSGLDFNPVPDRLRIVGSNDQNLRANVDDGATLVDGTIAYATGDANDGVDPNITAVAYTNSFPPSPAPGRPTILYGIDSVLDILVRQDPPNNGTLNTIGSLGIDFGSTGGFDILSTGLDINTAFAASGSSLYNIDLGTGGATNLGTIGGGSVNIVGLASQSVPEPGTIGGLLGFGAIALLKRFRSKRAS